MFLCLILLTLNVFRSPQSEDQQYDALVESLQDPFLTESKRMKKEIATLVPAVNRVKATYKTLDQHVDTAYGQGIVQFNKACTEIEATMSIEQTEFRTAYQSTKVFSSIYAPYFTHVTNEG